LESEPPAAALARAQYWLRTTTNFELKNWLADDSPTLTVKSQTLEGLPLEDGTHKPFKTGTPQLGAMWVQDVMKDAIRRLQEWTQEDKDDNLCPYADPVYWSAFQLTGW
jgi:CHAT domain-containing protein